MPAVLWCCFLQTRDGSPASATDSWTALSSLAHPQLSKALHTSAGHSPDLGWPCSLSSSWPWVVPAPPFDYSQPNPFLPVSHTPPHPMPGLSFALPSPSPTSPCLSPIVLSSRAKGWSDAFHRCSAGSLCCSLRFLMALRCWAAVSWQF